MQSTADLLGVKFYFRHLGYSKAAITKPKISSDLYISFPDYYIMEGKNTTVLKFIAVNKNKSRRKILKIFSETKLFEKLTFRLYF